MISLGDHIRKSHNSDIFDIFLMDCNWHIKEWINEWEYTHIACPLWDSMGQQDVADEVAGVIIYWRLYVAGMRYNFPCLAVETMLDWFDPHAIYGSEWDMDSIVSEEKRWVLDQ